MLAIATPCLGLSLWTGGAGASVHAGEHARRAGAPTQEGGRAHRATATLDVVSGTTSVDVSAAALSGFLYRVRTPAGSGIRPLATLDHGSLRVGQASEGDHRQAPVLDIQLARGVRWIINLDGGATTESVAMTSGMLTSLTFGAGVGRASVRLPPPVGTLTLTLAGGATQLTVVAPQGAPAEVRVAGGASQVVLDGNGHTGVAGGAVFADPGWDGAHYRYAIDLLAGVSEFQMSRS